MPDPLANAVPAPTAGRERARSTADGRTGFVDRFDDDVATGRVVGSESPAGIVRRGVDRESVVSIDHGALRFQPLVIPGWGRSGIAYGPFPRAPGLTLHALVLNGHNMSRSEPLPDRFRGRLSRWAIGSETEHPMRRMLHWLRSGDKRHMWRRLRQWMQSGPRLLHWPWLEENLAIGWFPTEAPSEPLREGSSLAVHAILPKGGELWARVGSQAAPTVGGLQNVPVYYTVVLREHGAAYYASSPVSVEGLDDFPRLRLLAIDPFNAEPSVYAGIHQSVLGEIGFRVDTRVYGVQVIEIPEVSAWYGTAHGADALTGDGGSLASTVAEVGGEWTVPEGRIVRSERGAIGQAQSNLALLSLPSSAGLVHLLIECDDRPVEGVALIWRAADERNFWSLEVGSTYAQLAFVEDGHWHRHARVAGRHLPPNSVSSLQVYDDGDAFRIHLNGALVYGTTFSDDRLKTATGVGFRVAGTADSVAIREFEAHPRDIRIPGILNFGGPRFQLGERIAVADDFEGPAGDLAGHATSVGGCRWTRRIGTGVIELTGNHSARVKASALERCPGRTAYAIPWPDAELADLAVTITPAGMRSGAGEKGRAGLIFWQDPDNYLIVNNWVESWPAMSVSAFFRVAGFEELYDAVWTNVGTRLQFGEPHDFRVVFDGREFTAYVNQEAVLYRALTDVYPACQGFRINEAGIVANWEWGTDTGSKFEKLVGRTRP